ncbi:hypothetical protein DPMN_175613 [Dreissena polymorpha]|uniref:Uncharacterized protein n=1 Tax=Dreissena polymorpha TaxID=45954 RepID=A0A9D4E7M8_DREPO|nr:hypothetical protein DPMN_175613 [Dreissena polymorpha]
MKCPKSVLSNLNGAAPGQSYVDSVALDQSYVHSVAPNQSYLDIIAQTSHMWSAYP